MKLYYTFSMTKTYSNGTTYKTRSHQDRVNDAKAKVDAEDKAAGLTGTWEIEVDYS